MIDDKADTAVQEITDHLVEAPRLIHVQRMRRVINIDQVMAFNPGAQYVATLQRDDLFQGAVQYQRQGFDIAEPVHQGLI